MELTLACWLDTHTNLFSSPLSLSLALSLALSFFSRLSFHTTQEFFLLSPSTWSPLPNYTFIAISFGIQSCPFTIMEPSRQAASKSDTHVTFRQGYQDTNYIGITIGDQQDEGTKSTTMNKGPPLAPPPPQHIGTPLDYRHSFNGFSRTKTTRQQQQQPTSSSSLSRHASISLPAINTNLHPPAPPQHHHHIPSGSPMLSPRYPTTPTFQQSSPLYSPLRSAPPPPLSPIYKPSSPVKSGAFWKVKASSSSYPPPPPPLRASTSSNKVKYTSN